MITFCTQFTEADAQPIQYKGKTLHWYDRFAVKSEDTLIINIESAKKKFDWDNNLVIQGLSVDITGTCEHNNKHFIEGKGKKQGVKMLFFDDTAPRPIIIKLHSKKDCVVVQNMWEHRKSDDDYYFNSMIRGAAMIIEEIPNGKRYYCNDYEANDDFDDIIFTVIKKSEYLPI